MKTLEGFDRIDTPLRQEADLDLCWLVVINHHETRIFHSLKPGTLAACIQVSRTQAAIRHTDPGDGFFRRPERPAPHCYLEPIVRALKEAPRLLVFGSGTGVSNQMDQFILWLNARHPALARRIAACLIVDEHHLTDAQMLARARTLYLSPRAALLGAE